MVLRLTPRQSSRVHSLARDECCNFHDGFCILLDDGDRHPCVQLESFGGIYCTFFRKAVLPADKRLFNEIIRNNKSKHKKCSHRGNGKQEKR